MIYHKSVETDDLKQIELSGNKSSYVFSDLKCGTRYQYYITAFNEVGKSEPSNVISIVTEGSGKCSSWFTIRASFLIYCF